MFPSSPRSQMLISARRHLDLQNPGVCDWGEVGCKSYPTVRLGAPAKLKYLHSKIGRRVDFSSYKKPVCSQSGGVVNCISAAQA